MSKNLLNIKDRILYFAENEEVNKQEFFRKTGLNYSNFTGKSKESDLNSKSVAEILLKYPKINPIWLLTGKGEMIKKENVIVDNSNLKANNSVVGNNITGNLGNVTLSLSSDDISTIIDLQKELTERLKASQNQIDTLLEILKSK